MKFVDSKKRTLCKKGSQVHIPSLSVVQGVEVEGLGLEDRDLEEGTDQVVTRTVEDSWGSFGKDLFDKGWEEGIVLEAALEEVHLLGYNTDSH